MGHINFEFLILKVTPEQRPHVNNNDYFWVVTGLIVYTFYSILIIRFKCLFIAILSAKIIRISTTIKDKKNRVIKPTKTERTIF